MNRLNHPISARKCPRFLTRNTCFPTHWGRAVGSGRGPGCSGGRSCTRDRRRRRCPMRPRTDRHRGSGSRDPRCCCGSWWSASPRSRRRELLASVRVPSALIRQGAAASPWPFHVTRYWGSEPVQSGSQNLTIATCPVGDVDAADSRRAGTRQLLGDRVALVAKGRGRGRAARGPGDEFDPATGGVVRMVTMSPCEPVLAVVRQGPAVPGLLSRCPTPPAVTRLRAYTRRARRGRHVHVAFVNWIATAPCGLSNILSSRVARFGSTRSNSTYQISGIPAPPKFMVSRSEMGRALVKFSCRSP